MSQETAPPILRLATPQDAPALAALHVAVWRETYGELAPAEAAERLDNAHRLAGWTAALADPQRSCWLAEDAGGATGLIAIAPAGEAFGAPEPCGEIAHLYVAARARQRGLGAALLRAALDAMARQGLAGATLGVVRQNYAARLFYAKNGGREVAEYTDPGPLWRSLMVRVAWDLPRG